MADSIQIPQDIAKVVEIKYTPDLLRKFLTDLLNEVNILKSKVVTLETRVKELEDAS